VTDRAGHEEPPARRLPHVSAAQQRRLQRVFRLLQTAGGPALAARAALQLYRFPRRRRLDAVDAPCLAAAQIHWIDRAQGRLRLLQWGTGPFTVLLQHGWGSHAPRWSAFVAEGLARGWRMLALDAPGHGASAGRLSDLPAFEAGLRAALMHAGGAVDAVVAHSLGALAAVRVFGAADAAAAPAALVLVSLPRDLDHLLGSFEALLGLDARTRAALRSAFVSHFGATPAGLDAAEALARLAAPVLLIHDVDDDVVPFAHAQALLRQQPAARLRATDGLGHSGPLRDPATVKAAMDFIAAAAPHSPLPR
jgi:pimeloyl-ACP methyl ester carboxylesterase